MNEVKICHGFRKFFTKGCIDSNMKAEIREMLLGHKIGLASAYYKPSEAEMLSEYNKAISQLTISEEARLHSKLEESQKTTSGILKEFEKLKKDVMEIKRHTV